MIDALAEALRDLALPCSLVLVIPGAAATLATQAKPMGVALAGLAGATTVGWLRLTGRIPASLSPWAAVVVALLVLVAFGALASGATRSGQRFTGGFVIGSAAAAIWTPCVGEELGAILNRAPTDPLGVLLPFAAFMTGISAVAIAISLARIGFALPASVEKMLFVVGTTTGLAVSLLIGTGAYTEVVARLVLWSL